MNVTELTREQKIRVLAWKLGTAAERAEVRKCLRNSISNAELGKLIRRELRTGEQPVFQFKRRDALQTALNDPDSFFEDLLVLPAALEELAREVCRLRRSDPVTHHRVVNTLKDNGLAARAMAFAGQDHSHDTDVWKAACKVKRPLQMLFGFDQVEAELREQSLKPAFA